MEEILNKVIELGFREDQAISFIKIAINNLEMALNGKPVFQLAIDENFNVKDLDHVNK